MTPANDTQAGTPSARELAIDEWADRTLELSRDAHGAEYRRRMLQQIETAEYVLPESSRAAMRLRSHAANGNQGCQEHDAASDLSHFDEDDEERMREELLTFSAEFFELPPDLRRQRWESIQGRVVTIPRLLTWLNSLQPGLEITFEELSSLPDEVQPLAQHILELFPLPPALRARRRREVIAGLSGATTMQGADNGLEWEHVAEQLREGWPHLAELGPDLVNELESYSRRKMQVAVVVVARCKTVAKLREDARLAAQAANESWFGLWKYVLAGIVLFSLRTWLVSTDSPRPQPTRPYGPSGSQTITPESMEQLRATVRAYKERRARRAAGIRDSSDDDPSMRSKDAAGAALLKLFGDEPDIEPAKREANQASPAESTPTPSIEQPSEATGSP